MSINLLTPIEPLCEELAACLRTEANGLAYLRHPLVYSVPHFPQLNGQLNAGFAAKKEYLADALTAGDFSKAIHLHERPYRFWALAAYEGAVDDATFWNLFGECWTDSENIHENVRLIRRWLEGVRPGRAAMMDPADFQTLRMMPETLTVYRGHQSRNRNGYSWTLSWDKAKWFATRFKQSGAAITTGTIKRDRVIAFFRNRGEDEIACLPRHVIGWSTVKL